MCVVSKSMKQGIVFDGSSALRSRGRCIVRITNKETTEKGTDMNTNISYEAATEWLANHYENVPGIWKQFDLASAADALAENAEDLNLNSFNDLPVLDLMCIMADSRM